MYGSGAAGGGVTRLLTVTGQLGYKRKPHDGDKRAPQVIPGAFGYRPGGQDYLDQREDPYRNIRFGGLILKMVQFSSGLIPFWNQNLESPRYM